MGHSPPLAFFSDVLEYVDRHPGRLRGASFLALILMTICTWYQTWDVDRRHSNLLLSLANFFLPYLDA